MDPNLYKSRSTRMAKQLKDLSLETREGGTVAQFEAGLFEAIDSDAFRAF